ncbi:MULTISPECIES: phosphorothioated DNA-binding restriction endonuclease [unclassified Imperialibacter]|uniref:phosphorothioated DNA-binding restriction endonuclease n=1 Tax=unclassified Imperialibacter TaxID=2629706 RepID=UPI0012561903|nr:MULTISPECIES: HNH endonuclease [unclassified Imperialibacter]CAD5299639.1 putative restriction endonuclease [Imperialibacter sp. 89]CAD5300151.1 putative restriction endonuclease [Imperialibacter sp. 75]VVT15059.1 putative restriction endonuclease [Imperialibacter sp. EC-SDR9]
MTPKEVLQKFETIRTWGNGDKRAPHKPLLILLALGSLQNNKESLAYREVDEKLTSLLEEFGSSKNQRPFYPFVRLANDHIWTFDKPELIESYHGEDPGRPFLFDNDIHAGFSPAIIEVFNEYPTLINEVAHYILDSNFPESIHNDILSAVGLDLEIKNQKRKVRDQKFREKILVAYEYQCAVCGFNLRLSNHSIALDAAHIKWHQAGGPDTEVNGLALCTLHHKLFDLGAYKLSKELVIIVSDRVNGTQGLEEWLLRFHNKQIRFPQRKQYYPEPEYIVWHWNDVFKGYGRD